MALFQLPLVEGLVAGLVVATLVFILYSRTQRQSASRTLTAAHKEAEALVTEAAGKAQEARNQIVLEGKMEILRLREDLDKEAQRRREEWERFERRVEERDQSLERKLEEARKLESGFGAREAALAGREGGAPDEGSRNREAGPGAASEAGAHRGADRGGCPA